jgi:phage terminase large subunit
MAREIVLPIKFRSLQAKIDADSSKKRYYVAVCHRGFGKTYFATAWLIKQALMNPKKKFAYIAPELKQAKKVTWADFKRNLAPIPGIEFNETELLARVPNGSVIYLEGAENPDRIRGNHYTAIVLDEVGDMPSTIWDLVLFPALQANRGKALFIGTPKGQNLFYKFFMRAADPEYAPEWGSCLYTLYDTGVFDDEQIKSIEREYSGREAQFAQEYMCSWDAELEIEASAYGKILHAIQDRGQIAPYSIDPLKPVYVGIDIGLVDSTCMWFAQYDPTYEKIVIMDYYENRNQDIQFYLNVLNSKNYVYANIFLPHDAQKRSMATKHNVVDLFKSHGYRTIVLPKTQSVMEDVQAVKSLLNKAWFNTATVSAGLKQLREYGVKTDKKTGIATGDLKHSDCADAFRYLMLGLSSAATRLTENRKSNTIGTQAYTNPLERFRELNLNRGPSKWR